MEEDGNMERDEKLIGHFRDISHAMRDLSEGRGSQSRILMILASHGPVTQKELTECLGIQPGSASEVLLKLENNGLITRTTSENDRRTTVVSLTGEGMCQAEEVREARGHRHREMFSCLSQEEKETLIGLLEKINQDWWGRCQGRRKHHPQGGHGRRGMHRCDGLRQKKEVQQLSE